MLVTISHRLYSITVLGEQKPVTDENNQRYFWPRRVNFFAQHGKSAACTNVIGLRRLADNFVRLLVVAEAFERGVA